METALFLKDAIDAAAVGICLFLVQCIIRLALTCIFASFLLVKYLFLCHSFHTYEHFKSQNICFLALRV